MKESIVITPGHKTWRQFCDEPELTPEEWILWRKLSILARTDKIFLEHCLTNLPQPTRSPRTRDWSDVVQDADRWRRYMRAHFPLYRDYLTKGGDQNGSNER